MLYQLLMPLPFANEHLVLLRFGTFSICWVQRLSAAAPVCRTSSATGKLHTGWVSVWYCQIAMQSCEMFKPHRAYIATNLEVGNLYLSSWSLHFQSFLVLFLHCISRHILVSIHSLHFVTTFLLHSIQITFVFLLKTTAPKWCLYLKL